MEYNYNEGQQKKNKNKNYKYYQKEIINKGVFDLRFDSMKQSVINQNSFSQVYNAASFQLNKWWNKKKQVIQVKMLKKQDFINQQNKVKVTWIGHASVLLSFGSKINILVDPIFDDRVTPFQKFPIGGEKRLVQCPCKLQDLPPINCILISHDHYDHLDYMALQKIAKINQKTDNLTFVTGRNMKDVLPKNCQNHTIELSWTESKVLSFEDHQFKITFVPACHWCKRGLLDQNHRLWGGFVIQSEGFKVYYSGDTGYDNGQIFRQIHDVFGDFDLCLLPIGAYKPRQLLKFQHVNPDQSVMIHKIMNCKKSLGIHWGTFPMSQQTAEQVVHDLKNAIFDHEIKQDSFVTIKQGQSLSIQWFK